MRRLLALVLTIALLFSFVVFAQGNAATPTPKTTSADNKASQPIPINCFESSEIPLPEGLKIKEIEGISMSKGSDFIPVKIEINEEALIITPTEYFEYDQEYSVKIFAGTKKYDIKVKAVDYQTTLSYDGIIIKVPPKKESGFNFPYYIYLPEDMEKSKTQKKRLIVEPNNTGSVSDLLGYHDEAAKRMIESNGAPGHYAAYNLKYPFMVPVFPRPMTNWWEAYTHALDRGAMMLEGEAERLDLQLLAMIKDANKILTKMGYKMESKIFMTGFSASGQFTNRFATLHPEVVKAIAVGNFTMYPTAKLNGVTLNYPWGIADIKKYTGKEFNKTEYDKIAQFCYIGDQDQNDQPYNVDFGTTEEETKAVNDLFGYDYGVTKWNRKWKFVQQLGYDKSIQFHTYKGIGHSVSDNILKDIYEFFKANNGDKIVKIKAHTNAF
jgi:hypothetical protein